MGPTKKVPVVIAGSRSAEENEQNYQLLVQVIEAAGLEGHIEKVLSGRARGWDRLGEVYSQRVLGKLAEMYVPSWGDLSHPDADVRTNKLRTRYDHNAAYRRNLFMGFRLWKADPKGEVVAFWDDRSEGTRDMIEVGRWFGLRVTVCHIRSEPLALTFYPPSDFQEAVGNPHLTTIQGVPIPVKLSLRTRHPALEPTPIPLSFFQARGL